MAAETESAKESTAKEPGDTKVDGIIARIESALKDLKAAQAGDESADTTEEESEPGTKVPVKAQPKNLKDASVVARRVMAGKKAADAKAAAA